MKKVNKSSQAPAELDQYTKNNPNDNWKEFCDNEQQGYKAVRNTLRADQGGLCAYCENELVEFHGVGLDDFRVEHFHPKKRPPAPPPNWALDWKNLLAVCTGGNAKFIGDQSLFTTPDHSCDVPKGEKNLVGIILDPINDVPAFPALFEFNELGGMKVSAACPTAIQNKARETIEHLRLSPHPTKSIPNPRLIRFRKAVIEELRRQTESLVLSGLSVTDAAAELAEVYFSPSTNDDWPAFFSTIRWYLGPAAETRLSIVGYNG